MKLPASYYNLISYIGVTVSGVSLALMLFFFVFGALTGDTNAYVGIITFLILPVFLIIGLALIPIGMWIQTKRAKGTEGLMEKRLILNLNLKSHRNASVIFLIGTFIFLLLTGIGSYEAYHYSESVEFCGTMCHTVMEPEYVAYQNSAHAKVTCAECHIGSGAEWFVKAKISGLYQVYSVIANKYPTPIETPIKNLRPAQETCEKCHWPQKFYENSLKKEKYFIADENNTPWDVNLEMKIGPKNSAMGLAEGIHWHINQDIEIQYVHTDHKREKIPWVRFINKKTQDTTIYNDSFDPIDNAALDTLEIRTMDCMDCHNRPAHNYLTPAKFVDQILARNESVQKLPEFKMFVMGLLYSEYDNADTAEMIIRTEIATYYNENYPDIAATKSNVLNNAVDEVIRGFRTNIFPEMKVTWDAYPDHIGHMEFDGCFRCHNNTHESNTGKVISKDCNLCHSIIGQGSPDSLHVAKFNESLDFMHPVDIDGAWSEMLCSECHRYLY